MSDIETIGKELYRIPIPIPFPMKFVYAYVAIDSDGVVVIDTGFNVPEAKQAWKDALRYLKIEPHDIRMIYLTHFHPDHFGLSGWMQEWTGALVAMSEPDLAYVNRVWRNGTVQADQIGELMSHHGVPNELVDGIVKHMLKLATHVVPLPDLTALTDAEVILAGELWQVLPTPGHSDGHVCFYNQGSRSLIAGDHLLDPITPNISLWPGCRPNPLLDYMKSLQHISLLEIDNSYGGHGKPIPNVRERIGQLERHHKLRLERMYTAANDSKTAYEVASEIFSEKALTPHQWRFAMAETLAHLEYLRFEGKLIMQTVSEVTQYSAEGGEGVSV